jgi:hypothetical protein
MVLSSDPDTIFVPSKEKATEKISLLCALFFSARRFREPVSEARKRQLWPRRDD